MFSKYGPKFIFQVKIFHFFNEKLGSSREVKCPKCHGPFQLPLKGVEDLPTNYFTAGVVSASIKKESVDPNNVICEICEKTQATEFCQDCAMNFCADCKKGHLKPRATARHQFITIDEALKGGSSSSAPRILHCQKHPQYEVNSYCKTDQTAICAECVVDAHIGHDVSRLVDFSKGFKDTLSTLVNKVRLFSTSFFPFNICFSNLKNKSVANR